MIKSVHKFDFNLIDYRNKEVNPFQVSIIDKSKDIAELKMEYIIWIFNVFAQYIDYKVKDDELIGI